ncbi:MarR family winged helix-turn-helix transcriptional regulator [Microbaculum marinisediminis]|uniref:MarR family transcriptional regulator n=1 Tax=Microbaculum marinisediminis TaxID=2931392 RepID=A0AAW5R3E5_9HYPH|nr:MarR family transcriptional regulator [Microbaculum sp. A6E488]MCT8974796.1 MarR family transcriptional regulator [Microbaculum sp. A6E488]
MKFERSESAGYLANLMGRLFTKALQKAVEPYGLAPAQFTTMVEIWRDPGVTQRLLVERLGVEQGTMTNTLSRMERDGLILRRPHETDGRAQTLHLTDKAKAVLEPAIMGAIDANEAALGCLSADERDRFLAMMMRVIDALRDHVGQDTGAQTRVR